MKNGLLFFTSLFLLVHNSSIFAQNLSFEKTYPSVGRNATGYSIIETDDNGYLIGGYKSDDFFIAKIYSSGILDWSKSFDTEKLSKYLIDPLHKTSDSNYIAVTTKMLNDDERIACLKIDKNGNTLWTKIYDNEIEEFGFDFVETEDGYLILGGSKNYAIAFKKYRLLKTDYDGNILWTRENEVYNYQPNNLQPGLSLTKISDSLFVIGSNRSVVGINQDGETVWTKNLSCDLFTVIHSAEDSIVLAGKSKIEILNSNGESILAKDIAGTINSIYNLSDGGYIAVGGSRLGLQTPLSSYILKLDSNLDSVWQTDINGIAYKIIQSGEQFVGAGNNTWLYMVYAYEGSPINMLYLTAPEGGETLSHKYNYTVRWFNQGIRAVDLHYSTDKGGTWHEIVTELKNPGNSYVWDIPDIETDSCLIRIRNSEMPDFENISDDYFSVKEFFRIGEGSQPGNDSYDYIAINEILMWVSNCGDGSYDPIHNRGGFYWPNGLNGTVSAIISDGLIYAGMVNEELRINGNMYRQGWQAGYINENGEASDPNEAVNKVWKIRKDWQDLPEGPWKDQYEYDYNNWPGKYGAPFIDVDNDSVFTQGVDQPEFIGDEVLFCVSNDLDPERTENTYGTEPIGLEFQTTVWGYNTENFLKDAVFKKYKIINKGNKTIEDMYISYWTDDDLGKANDDYPGCDTLLNLGYTFNGDNFDESEYVPAYGTPPPAIGHMMLQGPVIESSLQETAMYNNGYLAGHKNLPVTAFSIYFCLWEGYDCPGRGIEGGREIYYNMQGLNWQGNPYIDPVTGKETKFCVPGNPAEGTGWYCGEGWPEGPPPKDTYHMLSSGPFTLAPGDTQEVVYAIFMARGSDNVQSVAELKKTARKIHEFWGNDIPTGIKPVDHLEEMPKQFHLGQNYPNPFNPATTIEYSLPVSSWQSAVGSQQKTDDGIQKTEFRRQNQSLSNQHQVSSIQNQSLSNQHQVSVSLKVYDILGREVATLVNEQQKPGSYTVQFDAGHLSSGVYVYKLQADGFIKTRKMVLIK
jgi:hypothetical protein